LHRGRDPLAPRGAAGRLTRRGTRERLIRATGRCARARRVRPAGPQMRAYPRDRATNLVRPRIDPRPEERAAVIRFENVTKVYARGARPAVDDVSMEVRRGEFVFLVGASGSGKSTCLHLVLREERPTKGKVFVAGRDLGSL